MMAMADSTKKPQPGRRRTRTFATPDGVAGRTSLPGLATGLPYKRVRSGLSIRAAVAYSAPRHCRGSKRGGILRRHEVSPRNALGAARLIGLRAAWYGPFRDRPAPARDLRRPARGARAPGRRDHRRGAAHQPTAGIAARPRHLGDRERALRSLQRPAWRRQPARRL